MDTKTRYLIAGANREIGHAQLGIFMALTKLDAKAIWTHLATIKDAIDAIAGALPSEDSE